MTREESKTRLKELNNRITKCNKCELRASATQPVPGCGEIGAKYFIIGEACGREEDAEGIPFVGKSGIRLNKLLALAGIPLEQCYFTNVCRCRPPENRTPRKKEVAACFGYLADELRLVQPETIIVLGRTPLSLFTEDGVTQMHGTIFDGEIDGMSFPVIVQYHPAAALHAPRLWATLLDDWEHLPVKVPSDFIVVENKRLDLNGMPLASMDTEQDGHGGVGQWSVAYRDGESRLTIAPFYGQQRIEFGNCPVAFHNAKYDLRELKTNKMPVPEKFHDTMIMAYCLGLGKQAPKEDSKSKSGSDMVGGLGLKYLARRHLGMQMIKWEEVKDHPELVPEYNAKDSVATFLLAEKWLPILPKHYFDIDMPLLPVLMTIEDRGIKINPDYLAEFGRELDSRLGEFEELVQHLAFHTQDLQSYVYGTLDIEPWKFTDTGAPSVEAEVLEVIDDPTIKRVLEYKNLYKERGTYVENYVRAKDFNDRIHPEIKQTSTSTGRLSMARPNLQNVFKRDDRVALRALFVAEEDKKIVRVDYSQLDFRTLAAITQDPTLMKALLADKKIHQVTSEEMGIKYDDAKTVNFGTMFGQEAWALSQALHIPIEEARDFLRRYFERFPGIKKYRDQMIEIARGDKTVTIPFTNRKRRIDAMFSGDWRVIREGEKEAVNLPVQGLEAEVVKIAMIDLHNKHSAPMVLQVHDELLFEVEASQADEYARWIKEYIPTIVEFGGMKFPVGVGVGNNWYESMGNEI